jgi:carboxypeptidase PM20D1
VLLAFGDDEELGGGNSGAPAIVARLRARGVRPWLVVDEGGAVTRGLVPGVARPVAVVGVAEKGYVSLTLTARGAGGHSSAPPRHTAAGALAAAVARVEARPFAARTDGAATALLARVAPELPFPQRVVVANRWLFGPLLARLLARAPSSDAGQRTTTAVTMLEGSPKDNVLPSRARAVVNFRLMPGDTQQAVLAHVRAAVDDPAIAVRPLAAGAEASPVSPDTGAAWGALAAAVRQLFPGAAVAPYLVIGATDARHFAAIAPAVYRFSPVPMTARDLERMHGTNERIAAEDYLRAVRFSAQLVRNAAM